MSVMTAAARDAAAIETLWEEPTGRGPARAISPALAAGYGGALAIPLHPDRPTLVANFVTTLDGVTAFDPASATGAAEVSGFSSTDRFVMALLRALADVVLVGAGTVRAAADEPWTAEGIAPEVAEPVAALRRSLGLARHPTTAIVTGSGGIDLSHPGLRDPRVPVQILAAGAAAERLRAEPLPAHVAVEALGEARPSAAQLVRGLADGGARLILCEGGPHLFGELLAAQLVDEIFLTVAPQVAGRDRRLHPERRGLVEGLAFDPSAAPWWRLASLRRAASHLFRRYRLDRVAAGQGGIS